MAWAWCTRSTPHHAGPARCVPCRPSLPLPVPGSRRSSMDVCALYCCEHPNSFAGIKVEKIVLLLWRFLAWRNCGGQKDLLIYVLMIRIWSEDADQITLHVQFLMSFHSERCGHAITPPCRSIPREALCDSSHMCNTRKQQAEGCTTRAGTPAGKSFYFWRSKANYFEAGQKRISRWHTLCVHAGQYHALIVEDLRQPGCTCCRLLQSEGVMMCINLCFAHQSSLLHCRMLIHLHQEHQEHAQRWSCHFQVQPTAHVANPAGQSSSALVVSDAT